MLARDLPEDSYLRAGGAKLILKHEAGLARVLA